MLTIGVIGNLPCKEKWHEKNKTWDGGEEDLTAGMLFAAGLITGEALLGIFMAIPIVLSGDGDVLALAEGMRFGGFPGLIAVGAIAYFLYSVARGAKDKKAHA